MKLWPLIVAVGLLLFAEGTALVAKEEQIKLQNRRDKFAAAALAGLLTKEASSAMSFDLVVAQSVRFSDAIIKELEKTKDDGKK